jgi:aspartate/tyrosine/aromatic aminotransferase
MAERIIEMREVLYEKLTNELKTPGDWSHIKSQIGMFRYVSRTSFMILVRNQLTYVSPALPA